MPLKHCGSKVSIRGSSSRSRNGGWDEIMLVNPPIQPPYIPRAPMKATINGILFSALLVKICRDSYTKVYQHMSLVLKRQLHLDSFKDIPIPKLFAELDWIPLAGFIRTA